MAKKENGNQIVGIKFEGSIIYPIFYINNTLISQKLDTSGE